jgi:hypothetical protein
MESGGSMSHSQGLSNNPYPEKKTRKQNRQTEKRRQFLRTRPRKKRPIGRPAKRRIL